jgi:light-regulated signal transduction histidine kinase (bacteriophytochrome)
VSVPVSPLYDALGRIVGASTIARDRTSQVRAADRMKELNYHLLRSNEDLERFAFVASHDRQEPFRMITVYAQSLIKMYPGEMDQRASMFVDNIVEGTARRRKL